MDLETDFYPTLTNAVQLLDKELLYGQHAIEFGVGSGRSLRIIAHYLKSSLSVFGFDSFEGLPEDWGYTDCKKGHFSQNGIMPEIEGAVLYPGWFKDTIPQYKQDYPDAKIAFLHLDADLYSSTKTILEGVNNRIIPGTLVVCDEWCYNFDIAFNDHEQRAVKEWLKTHNRKINFINIPDDSFCAIERKTFQVVE